MPQDKSQKIDLTSRYLRLEAWRNYCYSGSIDLLHEVGKWVEMPALKSPEDLDNYPEFIAHITRNSKPLKEAATEIQRLLKQLEETNPTTDEAEKIAYINIATKPRLKQRVIALKG